MFGQKVSCGVNLTYLIKLTDFNFNVSESQDGLGWAFEIVEHEKNVKVYKNGKKKRLY